MTEAQAGYDVYAVKGVTWNPGGGQTPSNMSTSLFVGARQNGSVLNIGVWTADGTQRVNLSDSTFGAGGQQTTYAVGSAVVFNNLLYVFVAVYDPVPNVTIAYYVFNPSNNYQQVGGTQTVIQSYYTLVPTPSGSPPVTPVNAVATVWNGSIYVFGPPNWSMVGYTPMAFSSADGQNWSQVSIASLSTPFPPSSTTPSPFRRARCPIFQPSTPTSPTAS
jgi:hypothetical protein